MWGNRKKQINDACHYKGKNKSKANEIFYAYMCNKEFGT